MFDVIIQVIIYSAGALFCVRIISDYLKQSKLDEEFINKIDSSN